MVLDADVLIGALDGVDSHHDSARQLFTGWHESGRQPVISAVNLSEVLVAPAAERPTLAAARKAIAVLGVTIERPSEGTAIEASRLRARHPISLPDAYGLATARELEAPIASFDRKVLSAARVEKIEVAPVRV